MKSDLTENKKVIFFDLYQTLLDVELSVNNLNHEIEGWDVFVKSLFKYGKEIWGIWEPISPFRSNHRNCMR